MIFSNIKNTTMQEVITQSKNIIENAKNILLVSHKKIDGDGLSAMLAMKKFLERENKIVTALSLDEIHETLQFLPFVNEVESSLKNSNDFIISLNCKEAEVDKLKYSLDGKTLNIVITPKSGGFHAEDISTKQAIGKYDAIIILDTGDLDHLGEFYEDNTEMFFSTPLINIDHHASNTGFGQINMVDVTAASTTEVLYRFIQEFMRSNDEDPKEFLDADIATLLLTGLIVDTGSFQHTNTSPKALELAADLIELGARQQEIIQNIYKTKHLSTLKLWGRVLAKIEEDPIHKIVWSSITKEDLAETGSNTESAEGLIDELMTNAPGAEIVLLLKDSDNGELSASVRSTNIAVDTLPISQHFGGGGHKQASGFKQKGYNFNVFSANVISFVEQYQAGRLNLSSEDVRQLQESYTQQKAQIKQSLIQTELKLETKDSQHKSVSRDIVEELSQSARNQKPQTQVKPPIQAKQQNDKKAFEPRSNQSPKFEPRVNQNTRPERDNNQKQDFQKESPKPNQNTESRAQNNQNVKQENKAPQEKPQNKNANPNQHNKPQNQQAKQPVNASQKQVNQEPKKQEFKKPEPQKVQEKPVVQQEQKPVIQQVTPVIQEAAPVQTETPVVHQHTEQVPAVQVAPVAQEAPQQVQQQSVQAEPVVEQQQQQQQQQQQPVQQQVQSQPVQQTQAANTNGGVTKEQAAQYSSYYVQQLQTMDPSTPEYAQTYSYYQYYAQMAA